MNEVNEFVNTKVYTRKRHIYVHMYISICEIKTLINSHLTFVITRRFTKSYTDDSYPYKGMYWCHIDS